MAAARFVLGGILGSRLLWSTRAPAYRNASIVESAVVERKPGVGDDDSLTHGNGSCDGCMDLGIMPMGSCGCSFSIWPRPVSFFHVLYRSLAKYLPFD